FYVFGLCIKGKIAFKLNGQPIATNAGELFICPPKMIYDDPMISPDFECKTICVSDRLLRKLLAGKAEIINREVYLRHHYIYHWVADLACTAYYDLLRDKWKNFDLTFNKEILLALMQAVLLEFCAIVKDESDHKELALTVTTQTNELFRQYIDILSQETVKMQTVSWYANRLNVTPKYLSHICKKISGKTALDWIHEMVVEDVRYYLERTTFSIKEICVNLGFSNLSFFGKFTRKNLGYSPRKYRSNNR
ncbi:MAG: helix-turn-helix domain-containing protein, partial [Bacteroidaceae bacterium]|nr:helix-turn-helix domain-containing protein [Bacteroidaceae bacterium]